MQDQPEMKTGKLWRDSFNYAKERLPEILSSQLLYFILLLPIIAAMAYAFTDVTEHSVQLHAVQVVEEAVKKSGGKPDMTLINEETGKLILSYAKLFLVWALSYFFGKSFMHNLYDGLSKGTSFPRYTLFPVAKNVWQLMLLDLKIVLAVSIPFIVAVLVVGVIMLLGAVIGGALKIEFPTALIVTPIIIGPLFIGFWCLYRSLVLMAAPPTVYEHTPISLMKHFLPATKGYRWKIAITKAGIVMPVYVANIILSRFFNTKEINLDVQSMLIQFGLVTVLATFCMIWAVYLNVLLWQHIAPRARELAATPAA